MLAIRAFAPSGAAMHARAVMSMLRCGWRTLLPALAIALLLVLGPGTSWAQTTHAVPTASDIQPPPGTNIQEPPPDPDPPFDDATAVGISAPATMAPGSTAYVTVTMQNTGTTTWSSAVTYPYRLGSQNPQDNLTWGVGRVNLSNAVAPGSQGVFGFTITAPSTPGTYSFSWAMLRENWAWFGGTASATITVSVPPPVYDAQLVSTNVPSQMTAGGYYGVTLTFKNTGNVTWTSPDFLLANPDDNYIWGLNRVNMSPASVAPGQSAAFNFQLHAPTAAGTYLSAWGMVWEYHQRFGQTSSSYVTVNSVATTPKPTLTASHTSMVAGASFTMSWNTTDATSLTHVCTATGTGYTVNESLAVNGSRSMTAQSGWVGYPSSCTWTASGAGGSATYTETMTTVAGIKSSVTYIHTDGLGSPVARTSASGTVISRTRYEPYGYVASGVQPTIGFTGHVNDVDTGLTYMQQRYYDPVAGRFLSIDPVTTDANTGGSFNRYAYANNSPYRYVDPDGRFAFLLPLVPYLVDATVVVVGHYVLPGRQGREDTVRAVGNAILNSGSGDKGNTNQAEGTKVDGQRPTKTPNEGAPGSTYINPGSGQERKYGSDGKPVQDIDHDHDHGQGVPHIHDWGRDANGRPVRGPGRPVDPKPVPKPEPKPKPDESK
jgi:RHS repeat-associated protein